jgi:hypothetical protein
VCSFRYQVKSVGQYKSVWNSKGSGTRTKLSLWEPTVDLGVFSRNKVGILRLYIIHRYMYIDI